MFSHPQDVPRRLCPRIRQWSDKITIVLRGSIALTLIRLAGITAAATL